MSISTTLPQTPRIQRLLIQTHHITSRKKISHITKAAKRLNCAVILKTGSPPGIMIAESEGEGAFEWGKTVKSLRYKDFRLGRKEEVKSRGFDVELGIVKELSSVKELSAFLESDREMLEWWKLGMGFMKEKD